MPHQIFLKKLKNIKCFADNPIKGGRFSAIEYFLTGHLDAGGN